MELVGWLVMYMGPRYSSQCRDRLVVGPQWRRGLSSGKVKNFLSSTAFRPALGSIQPQGYRDLSCGGKAAGACTFIFM
jgi:hypothetical protein